MPRTEFWALSELRTSLLAAALAVLTMLAVGWSIYNIVEASMRTQLKAQLVEEGVLFLELFETGGMPALISALNAMDDAPVSGEQYASLFDETGVAVAGNLASAPDLLLMHTALAVTTVENGMDVLEMSLPIKSYMLVVGRDITIINETLSALANTLLVAGGVTTAILITLGWWMSRTSVRKLRRIAYTLDRVGCGDTAIRTGLTGKTEIDRIGAMIDSALERLSALVAASQNTTRAIAHDLRTPLNRAMVTVQSAISASPEERTQLLEDASDELVGLGRIFDTLLQIGRLETAQDKAGFELVDLSKIAQDAVDLIEYDILSKNQSVRIEASGPVWLKGDAQMLVQLLVNLLDNAHTHSPSGSSIVVRTGIENGRPLLEVRDDGPGIPESQCSDVIKPFVRLDESRSGKGTGLGLALVNAIAIRHGATLVLENQTPGLSVKVVFPEETDPETGEKSNLTNL